MKKKKRVHNKIKQWIKLEDDFPTSDGFKANKHGLKATKFPFWFYEVFNIEYAV